MIYRIHGKGWRRERKLANSVTFAGHDATRQSTDTLLLTFDPATPTPTESNTTPANDAASSLTVSPLATRLCVSVSRINRQVVVTLSLFVIFLFDT